MDSLARLPVAVPPLQITLVEPDHAAKIWFEAEPLITKALVRSHALNKTNASQVLANICREKCQLWVAHDGRQIEAAVIGFVVEWPLSKTYYLPIIGARPWTLDRWLKPMLAAIEHYARSKGCLDLGGEFRKGWAKAAGFEITGVTLQRKLL